MKRNSGFIKLTILVAVLLCLTVIGGSFLFQSSSDSEILSEDVITYTAFRGEFVSSVNEVGDVESSSNTEIRCRVKSKGRTGTTILSLVPEGTQVEEGDFLCQLDDSLLREELTERKIQVAKDKAAVIQARSLLDAARRKLEEYENGLYEQEVAQLDAEILLAQEKVERALEVKAHSETLNRKGYITQTQLKADIFAVETARNELKLAQTNKQVYEEFTRDRMIAEFKSEIEQQQAQLEASNFTLELSQQREADYEKQVANCRVTAPQAGTVVYANESDRRDSAVIIEEGAEIRDGQPIFFLPDPTQMQVNAKVNDSKISKVDVGQRVAVRVDTNPEQPIAGKVRRVSSFPLPRRYYQAPIEYEVFIDIVEQSPLIRGGLRAKVEIFVENIDDALQVPVSSLIRREEDYFVLVRDEERFQPRQVEVGSNNESFVIILSGLDAGEEVVVDADNYRDLFFQPRSEDLPEPGELTRAKNSDENRNAATVPNTASLSPTA